MHAILLATVACAAMGNTPPAAPFINEPEIDGQLVNPSDVHMETDPFSDPDPGDSHLCSDWEIWTAAPAELVWQTSCIGGVERLHSHLGDGVFLNSHAGRAELFNDTDYFMRTRHRDDSGDALTEWGPWSVRYFTTTPATAILPLEIDDAESSPTPTLTDGTGADLSLPGGGPSVRVESPAGETVLAFVGTGGANAIDNPPGLSEHVPARVRITAGGLGAGVQLPESVIDFVDHELRARTIYLPSVSVAPGADALFWVSENGATYVAQEGQTEPDFTTLARGGPTPWVARQPGYVIEVVASGFQLPTNIAFVPTPGPGPLDPLFYVTELYGSIKVVTNNGEVFDYATGLLNFNPTGFFPGSGEQGVTGVVVDDATGDVFAAYMHDAGSYHYPRVARFTSADGGLTANSQTVILDMVGETQGQSHQISNLTIGPDGKLYVHMGDGFDASTAQNLDSFRGKILRVNLDGTAPADNVFYDAGNGINSRDYVYAYGVRNPFGGAWRPSTGEHYEVENGPSVDRFAKIVQGRNYLWDGSNESMYNYAAYIWNPATAPTNLAFTDPSVFDAGGFPPDKFDHCFVAESGPTYATGPQSNGKRITEFVLDAAGELTEPKRPLIEYAGAGKATAVGLAVGPGGLYFTDLYKDQGASSPIDPGANVLRVRFVGEASFAVSPSSGEAPLMVSFTDTSSVPNPSGWAWTFGDGGTSTLQNPTHTYTADGAYDVRLTVTGESGVSITETKRAVKVGQVPAVALIGGAMPPTAADTDLAAHLEAMGFVVDVFDDEPGSRPTASEIAAGYDLAVVSSSITSGNVAGEFRGVDIPLITWEQALMNADRVPLASAGATFFGVDTISVTNNSHPITAGLALGSLQVFETGSTMSVATGTLGPGVVSLATRPGAPGDHLILAAESGATLLNGYTAPARRVFLFLEDACLLNATHEGEHLFEHAVCWALDLTGPSIVSPPAGATVAAGGLAQFSVTASGSSPLSYTWRRNGAAIPNAGSPTLTIDPVGPADAGDYDVVVSNPCGEAVSAVATLSVTDCVPDVNTTNTNPGDAGYGEPDGTVDGADLSFYVEAWLGQVAAVADVNTTNTNPGDPGYGSPDGVVDGADLSFYVEAWLAGCP